MIDTPEIPDPGLSAALLDMLARAAPRLVVPFVVVTPSLDALAALVGGPPAPEVWARLERRRAEGLPVTVYGTPVHVVHGLAAPRIVPADVWRSIVRDGNLYGLNSLLITVGK